MAAQSCKICKYFFGVAHGGNYVHCSVLPAAEKYMQWCPSFEFRSWRKETYKRDWHCPKCNQPGNVMFHDNGLVLCPECYAGYIQTIKTQARRPGLEN